MRPTIICTQFPFFLSFISAYFQHYFQCQATTSLGFNKVCQIDYGSKLRWLAHSHGRLFACHRGETVHPVQNAGRTVPQNVLRKPSWNPKLLCIWLIRPVLSELFVVEENLRDFGVWYMHTSLRSSGNWHLSGHNFATAASQPFVRFSDWLALTWPSNTLYPNSWTLDPV